MELLDIKGRWYGDGRRVILRGVNPGGDCKGPYPDGGTNTPSDFRDHRDVSFVQLIAEAAGERMVSVRA